MSDYRSAWESYRRLRNRCFALFIAYVPAVGAVAFVCAKVFRTLLPGFFLAGAWMLAFLYTSLRLQAWPCPRCGKWFAAKWWYNKGFLARRCVHCGLPKYSETDATN